MVKVKGSSNKFINIQMTGMVDTIRKLHFQKKIIESSADLGVIKAGAFIEEEVKESIIGNRVESKSVDTGRFVNSIEFKKLSHAKGKVTPKRKNYPNSKMTTQEIALLLEKGTSKIQPRRHFGNTKARNMGKVKEIIQKEIDLGII
jgi:hypothetical protein